VREQLLSFLLYHAATSIDVNVKKYIWESENGYANILYESVNELQAPVRREGIAVLMWIEGGLRSMVSFKDG